MATKPRMVLWVPRSWW